MLDFFEWYEQQKQKEKLKQLQIDQDKRAYKESVDRLMPKAGNEIELERIKGNVIECPKCKALAYEFKELVPNSYYARICFRCKHSEKF